MRALVAALPPFARTPAFAQLARYGIAGLGVTALSTAVYSAAAVLAGVAPMLANVCGYGVGLVAGYLVHSRWSFAARREEEAAMVVRFVGATLCGFALNSFWVWLLTGPMHLPPLAPVPAMVGVTPLLSFLVNRYWVFRVA
ncbi:MAG: GtrA family protein [Alphaproteobacteria bacterium]|nr:GtrA family protein [Alphaproteobacteria bacterium]